MPMNVPLLIAIAAIVAGCRTSPHAVVTATEPCKGHTLEGSAVALRDAAIHELLTEIAPEFRQVVITRAARVNQSLLAAGPEQFGKIVDPELADAILDEHGTAECWPQGNFSLQIPADSAHAGLDPWTAFRSVNPNVTGILSIETPTIIHSNANEEVAGLLVEFRCGSACGGLWFIVLRRDETQWTRVSLRNLLNY